MNTEKFVGANGARAGNPHQFVNLGYGVYRCSSWPVCKDMRFTEEYTQHFGSRADQPVYR